MRFYEPYLVGFVPALAFQTVAELKFGAISAGWGASRLNVMDDLISNFQVIHTSDQVVAQWVEIMVASRRAGVALMEADAWIAAAAKALDATLLTHDSDFNAASCPGLRVIRYDDTGQLAPQ